MNIINVNKLKNKKKLKLIANVCNLILYKHYISTNICLSFCKKLCTK